MRYVFLIFFCVISLASRAEIRPIQGELANGLRYILLPYHQDKGRVEIRLKVKAGSIDQNEQQNGVAHMLEHMVFRASQAYPQGVMQAMHQQGWQRGINYNAVTTADSTSYILSPPVNPNGVAQSIETSLHFLRQMLFSARLEEADLAKERLIVLEEWRSKQSVASRINQQRTASVRVDSRYARGSVLGSQQDIQQIQSAQLQRFYQQWYVPNNMTLLVLGDIEPEQVKQKINQYFTALLPKPLAPRDYYDPSLSAQLRIHQLQDPQSSTSQIAFIWRFDEKASRGDSQAARYSRLVDRLTLALLNQRLRLQQNHLAEGVRSVVVRKSEIGKNVVALGLFAGVSPQAHQQGLIQILQEIERLKRYPFSPQELAQQKQQLRQQIASLKQNTPPRDFANWSKTMLNTLLADKPYLPQATIAQLTATLLERITLEEVQLRLNQWLNAADRIVQYQLPNQTGGFNLTEAELEQLMRQTAQGDIEPPQKQAQFEAVSMPTIAQTGRIIRQQAFPYQQVMHWDLSNGDKLVWLKSPLAQDKSYFQAISSAGFSAKPLDYWQSQLASQLINQTPPFDWQQEQFTQWKKQHKLSLSLEQTSQDLRFSGQADNQNLNQLLQLFYAVSQQTQIKADNIAAIKQDLEQQRQRQADNPSQAKISAQIEILKYGKQITASSFEKQLAQLARLDETALNQQWRLIRQAPTTYYLVNNLEEEEIKPLVAHYLASIERGKPLRPQGELPIAGAQTLQLTLGEQEKQDIRIWWFNPMPWQGEKAMLASLLQSIATQQLKLSLRDQQLGIYSLSFTSRLNPQSQRLESELRFTASPEKSEALIAQAKQIYQQLASLITEQDVQRLKTQFQRQEQARLEQPSTWLNRLILSEEQYGDPRYLTDMQQLSEAITLEKLTQLARQLNNDNVKVFILRP